MRVWAPQRRQAGRTRGPLAGAAPCRRLVLRSRMAPLGALDAVAADAIPSSRSRRKGFCRSPLVLAAVVFAAAPCAFDTRSPVFRSLRWVPCHHAGPAFARSLSRKKIQMEDVHNKGAAMTQWEKAKEREWNKHGGLPHDLPRSGRQMAPDGVNVAVKDRKVLATEPLMLAVDRTGKKLLPGETVSPVIPYSLRDTHGMSAANAPMSWEELEGRYRRMDTHMYSTLGEKAAKTIETAFTKADGLDDYRTIRTFAWQDGETGITSSIMLIGVTETSARSRTLAARAVYEVEPTGLLVQLCRERVGRYLVMPSEHLATVANYARGYSTSNPHKLQAVQHAGDTINGDFEALMSWMKDLAYASAVDEFMQVASESKTLCLGDVRASRLEKLRRQQGDESLTELPTMHARGKQITRGLIGLASMGHRKVMGVVSVDLLPTITTWLEKAGANLVAVADASDIDAGRESLAADARMGLTPGPAQRPRGATPVGGGPRPPTPEPFEALGCGFRTKLGAFFNEDGLRFLQARKERLRTLTRVEDLVKHRVPDKVWQVADLTCGLGPVPGPKKTLKEVKKGLVFECGQLEIPDHYLRDAGMEGYAPGFWDMLLRRGIAKEARDLSELEWWAAESGAS